MVAVMLYSLDGVPEYPEARSIPPVLIVYTMGPPPKPRIQLAQIATIAGNNQDIGVIGVEYHIIAKVFRQRLEHRGSQGQIGFVQLQPLHQQTALVQMIFDVTIKFLGK